jgi:hypothetical protein
MAVYSVTNKYLLDDFAVLQLLTPTELEAGASIVVAGVDATFNGSYTVRALPQYEFLGVDDQGDLVYDDLVPLPNQVLYVKVADNVNRVAATGTLTYNPVCTWISAGDVQAWLNITVVSANDTALITSAAASASQFAWRRRQESGYFDSLTTVPSADVKLGTIMYAGGLYRSRGSLGDAFATFDGMGSPAPIIGLTGQIKQLLGIGRPAIA